VARSSFIESDPPGADVWLREYTKTDQAWRHLGKTPIRDQPMPLGYFLFKVSKEGFETSVGGGSSFFSRNFFRLSKPGSAPEGMVLVTGAEGLGATIRHIGGEAPRLSFYIGRYEVTNREFKTFLDHGGYQKAEYWKQPFRDGNRPLSWEQATARFRDQTGRPGPSTWEAGTFPEGHDDYPVSGVSWFEAAAFAEYAGKSLPTVYHWYRAADVRMAPFIIPASNFGGKGLAKVGSHTGVSPFGAYDMAGNVKEWCWNEDSAGMRFLLGGAWSDPGYQFVDPDAQSPWDRNPANGFRLARYPQPPEEKLFATVPRRFRKYEEEKPVSDDVFDAMRRQYSYDPKELKPAIDSVDETNAYWRLERVSFDAAYAGERVPAMLFLPKNGKPPYQTVVYHPGSGANTTAFPAIDNLSRFDFIVRSGRAVMYPVYKGTYNRRYPSALDTPIKRRDATVQRVQDMRRAVEYLLTRPDIDRTRLAYCGASAGGGIAPFMLAMEPLLRAAVLHEGGLPPAATPLPEVDALNFLPRVRVPVLMLNGRFDYTFPLEISQKPYFRLLGTPAKDKRHVVYDTAHDVTLKRPEMVRESLDWLDNYLGPVKQ
jgi:formylglycine-generating enzyme required for sulfatase activity/dienelactone hydrolase